MLTAPTQSPYEQQECDKDEDVTYDNGIEGAWQFWNDEAFIAEPADHDISTEQLYERIDPQVHYRNLLLQRFHALAEVLRPPIEAGDATTLVYLTAQHHRYSSMDGQALKDVERQSRRTYTLLRASKKSPTHSHLRSLSTPTVISVLTRISSGMLKPLKRVAPNLGAWLWTLLARLPDVLDGEQTYVLRELGKRAVLLLTSYNDPEAAVALMAAARDAGADGYEDEDEDEIGKTEDGDEADEAVEDKDQAPDEASLAALDMILTVVGEVFGQRDLLEFRPRWEVGESVTLE